MLYRIWGATRLRHLAGWVHDWTLPNMFAGVQGRSAEDAWYASALDLEHANLQGHPVNGTALDLMKCFDQILRALLYVVLWLSGFPLAILSAYMRFHEHLHIYFSFAGFLGASPARPQW